MIYIYYSSQSSIQQLTEPYNLYKLIDYLPSLKEDNSKNIQYFSTQLNLFLNDQYTTGKITKEQYASVMTNMYIGMNLLFLLLDQGVINWPEYLNCCFYSKDIDFCKGICNSH